MNNLNNVFKIQEIMFIIVPIFIAIVFILIVAIIISPKLRGKLMSSQIRAVKNMTDYSKEDIEDLMTNLETISINSKNKTINQNEDILKNIADKEAEINKNSITSNARAFKDGISNNDTVFCKNCGSIIDDDSKFCKFCGKEQ